MRQGDVVCTAQMMAARYKIDVLGAVQDGEAQQSHMEFAAGMQCDDVSTGVDVDLCRLGQHVDLVNTNIQVVSLRKPVAVRAQHLIALKPYHRATRAYRDGSRKVALAGTPVDHRCGGIAAAGLPVCGMFSSSNEIRKRTYLRPFAASNFPGKTHWQAVRELRRSWRATEFRQLRNAWNMCCENGAQCRVIVL